MSNEDQWVRSRVIEIRANHPLVTDAVSTQMEKVMGGLLSDQKLSQAKLAALANSLLADMVAEPPETDSTR